MPYVVSCKVVKDLIFLQESNCGTEGKMRSYLLQVCCDTSYFFMVLD